MIEFKRTPAIPGTIIDGSTGTIRKDGRIIGDYIEYAPGCYFASLDDDSQHQGTPEQVRESIATH